MFDAKNDIETRDFAILGSLFDNFGRRNKKKFTSFFDQGLKFYISLEAQLEIQILN